MSVLRFLGLGGPETPREADPADTRTVRKIVESLDRLEPERARYIAAFAYVLGRVAHADLEISPEETAAMERIVMEQGGIPEEQAVIVVQMAKTQNLLFGGTENYLVTREFKRVATREQKLRLLHCLFAVSSSDESIVSAEDTEIRKIASELGVSHKEFIAVKGHYREHLEVLKDPPKDR